MATKSPTPNPKRVEAGRRNRLLRKGLTPEGRERLRQMALRHQPWRFATGPRTPEGKAKAALNNKRQQKGPKSLREIHRELADIGDLARELRELCNAVSRVPLG